MHTYVCVLMRAREDKRAEVRERSKVMRLAQSTIGDKHSCGTCDNQD